MNAFDKLPQTAEVALARFEMARAEERIFYGENLAFGPGYGKCVEHYYEHDLPPPAPSNKLLDVVSEKLQLPRDRIVPVMDGSMGAGQYLAGVVEPEKVIPASYDLDIVVCKTAEDAKKLRGYAPVILPYRSTCNLIYELAPEETDLHHYSVDASVIQKLKDFPVEQRRLAAPKQSTEAFRTSYSESLGIPPEMLALHLGSDEILKSIFRGMREGQKGDKKLKAFIPLPNYFDSYEFARRFGFGITADTTPSQETSWPDLIKGWAQDIKDSAPDVVYISNPNNPTGYTLSVKDMETILESTPATTRVIIDEVNLDINKSHNLFSTPWRDLFDKFPQHHIIFVDSVSKSHDMVGERVGFAISSQADDAKMLQRLEPPKFGFQSLAEAGRAVHDVPSTESDTQKVILRFYQRLTAIADSSKGAINTGPMSSNFCTIEFTDEAMQRSFLDKLKNKESADWGVVRKLVGLPMTGAGEIAPEDENPDGTLKEEVFERKGILGLPKNMVRLSALSHEAVLDVLEKVAVAA